MSKGLVLKPDNPDKFFDNFNSYSVYALIDDAEFVSKPVNSVAPSISGTQQVGHVLTAAHGTWSGSPTSFHFQWKRATTSGGTYTNITGATTSTYTQVSGDAAKFIKVAVSATNEDGTANQVLSAATGAIAA